MKINDEIKEHISLEAPVVSQEIEEYVTNIVMLDSRYIFTFKKDKKYYGYCTHCKTEFSINSLKHNSSQTCPGCGSHCKVKNSWRGHKYLEDEACFMYYEKSVKDPNVIVGKGYHVSRNYRFDYKNVENRYSLEAIYLFNIATRKNKMFKASYYYREFVSTSSVYSFNNNSLRNIPFYEARHSIEKAIKETNFKYLPYEQLKNCNMLDVLNLYTKHPIIEQVVKAGGDTLIEQYLCGYSLQKSINWRGKDIYKFLKIGRKDLKDIREAKIKITTSFLALYQLSVKNKANLSAKEVNELLKIIGTSMYRLDELLKYVSLKKLYKYVKKQTEKQRKKTSMYSITSTWADYINDCIKLGMDITKEVVLFPKDVDLAHKNTIKQIKLKEDKQLNEGIAKRIKVLSNYSFESNGFFIRPANSSIELIEEGKALNHCVGTYAKRYSEGSTNIFVLRKAEEPDKPYYTMEFRENRIIQVRGKGNCNPTKDVEVFVKEFEKVKLKKKSRVKIPA